MRDKEDAAYKTVARSSGESASKECLRCGARVLGATISGPGAEARTNLPCGHNAPVREGEMTIGTYHIVCKNCDAENLIKDNERFVRELKEMHEEQHPDHQVEYAELELEQ